MRNRTEIFFGGGDGEDGGEKPKGMAQAEFLHPLSGVFLFLGV